jgi:hypothetical protein
MRGTVPRSLYMYDNFFSTPTFACKLQTYKELLTQGL